MIDPSQEERLLTQFRQWLQDARVEAERRDHEPREPVPADVGVEVREVGLYQLVEEFTALRQELKLQTRSARNLQDQTEAALTALRQASEQFRAVEPREAEAAWTAGKKLAEALADLDEALDRGRAEIDRAGRRLIEEPTRVLEADLKALFARQSWLRRRLVGSYHEQVLQHARQQGSGLRRELVEALREGYGLIQDRLARALKAEQIHRIPCAGRPVDPELMIVVEVADDPDRPSGQVVEEVRRGYTWQGRLLRYAEVRASRTPPLES